MKFTAVIVGLAAVRAIASPVERRQNDVAKCENGSGTKENDTWDYASGKAQCEENCYLSEDDGNGDVCRGYCRNAGHPVPIWMCMGSWPN
ncbi:hypothetical protein WHR41_04183 [Cladosporium halotolerans]|uniref:Secreted protein n=1 Tax=Cladosporium halotolerans TaxID=1052096 RepID=A0AB34KPF9_9PEZI